MILEIEEAAERYCVSPSTIRRNHDIIESKGGFEYRSSGGSHRNLYKSSVLDALARDGTFGHKAVKAMAERMDHVSQT